MTALHAPRRGFFRNLRDLPAALSLSGFIAGLLVVITGYTGPILLVLGAAEAGGLSTAETASWIWAVAVGDGVMTMLLSLYYRQPIIAPWSTAGVAVLAAALPSISLPQAVGAYIVCGLAVAALGASGLFARALALVPTPVITGVIAGILLTFGKGVYTALGSSHDCGLFHHEAAPVTRAYRGVAAGRRRHRGAGRAHQPARRAAGAYAAAAHHARV
jgi:benzoate membrane transport protein